MSETEFAYSKIRKFVGESGDGLQWSKEAIIDIDGIIQMMLIEVGALAEVRAEEDGRKTVKGRDVIDAFKRFDAKIR